MKTFYKLLVLGLIVGTTNNFVWFALTFWVFLETQSVISTALVGGGYAAAAAICGFWFGSIVDNYKKKHAMLGSSIATLVLFTFGFIIINSNPASSFNSISSPILWVFALVLLGGAIAGNILTIAIPTLVTHLVEANRRDKANGMTGTMMGLTFSLTSITSGFTLAFLGMVWVMGIAITMTIIAILFLTLFIHIPEKRVIHLEEDAAHSKDLPTGKQIDIKGTIKVIAAIPGLFALIFFTTFNNFLGGIFMALMDAYGLTLMPVQAWGSLFAVLSFGFIFGGLFISKFGLGKNPLKALFRVYLVMWTVCIFFTIQPSIILLSIGILVWISLYPFIEATEQTIIQKVVPRERQGRVFGVAQSIEQAASPLTAFAIGPIAQFIFIPFMTTGAGVELIGGWFGVGLGRGIALVFITAGIIGLIVTFIVRNSPSYKLLAKRYMK